MKIKNANELMNRLRRENYDIIAIWKKGTWCNVDSGYGGEQSGDNPEIMIRRTEFYDKINSLKNARKFINYINKYEKTPEYYDKYIKQYL